MNKDLFQHYASSYGAELAHWPEDVVEVAGNALLAHPEWQSMLEEEHHLDKQLDAYQLPAVNLSQLESMILQQTTENVNLLDQLINWLMPSRSIWRPALAACLPLLIGVILGTSLEIEDQYLLSEEIELFGVNTTAEVFDDEI